MQGCGPFIIFLVLGNDDSLRCVLGLPTLLFIGGEGVTIKLLYVNFLYGTQLKISPDFRSTR